MRMHVALTLLTWLGLVMVLFDGQVQWAVLISHEQLAKDGILCRGHSRPSSAIAGSCSVAEGRN